MRTEIIKCDLCGEEIKANEPICYKYKRTNYLGKWDKMETHYKCYDLMMEYIKIHNDPKKQENIENVVKEIKKEYTTNNIEFETKKKLSRFTKDNISVEVWDDDHIYINNMQYISLNRFGTAVQTALTAQCKVCRYKESE